MLNTFFYNFGNTNNYDFLIIYKYNYAYEM